MVEYKISAVSDGVKFLFQFVVKVAGVIESKLTGWIICVEFFGGMNARLTIEMGKCMVIIVSRWCKYGRKY